MTILYEEALRGLQAMINLDFGTDWGNAAAYSFKNKNFILGLIQEFNGMAEAAVDLGLAYFGAAFLGAAETGLETAITTGSLTSGFIDGQKQFQNSVNKGKNVASKIVNNISNFLFEKSNTKKSSKGLSVIGPRNNYREFAKSKGAHFLDVKDEDWSQKKNLKYLKGVVSRKDDVIFSCDYDPAKLDPNSVLAWEINYLETHGYEYVGNNIWSKK